MSRQDDQVSTAGTLMPPFTSCTGKCLGSLRRKGDWLACATYQGLPVGEHLCGGSEPKRVDTRTFLLPKGIIASWC